MLGKHGSYLNEPYTVVTYVTEVPATRSILLRRPPHL